jgi:hypothetical protein
MHKGPAVKWSSWAATAWLASGCGASGAEAIGSSATHGDPLSVTERAFSSASYTVGEPVVVTLSISPDVGALAYGVEEAPPTGWVVSEIDNAGQLDRGVIKWGVFLDSDARTLTYSATPDAGSTDARAFTGRVSVDGVSQPLGGSGSLTPGSTPVNGTCGTVVNACVTGLLVDAADTATEYRWTCEGQGGGTSASCSAAIPTGAPFAVGQCVQITVTPSLRVRAHPTTGDAELGTQPTGAQGTITDGPASADGYAWWEIDFENGMDGWVIQAIGGTAHFAVVEASQCTVEPVPTCTDSDGDGYGAPPSPACAQPLADCDDSDPAVHPGAAELCDDGRDNDCDSVADALDTATCPPEDGSTPPADVPEAAPHGGTVVGRASCSAAGPGLVELLFGCLVLAGGRLRRSRTCSRRTPCARA